MAKTKMGSSAKGRQHSNHGKKYMKQWGRTAKNKKKAWGIHLKNNPNDGFAKSNIEKARETLRLF